MDVIIGIDPHKASHTAVAVGDGEVELARLQVRSGRGQLDRLLAWAEPLRAATLGDRGRRRTRVPARAAARRRRPGRRRRAGDAWRRGPGCWATAGSNKNDPNDALSVAVTALRHRELRTVRPAGYSELLRLFAEAPHRPVEPAHPARGPPPRPRRRALTRRNRQGLNSTDAAKFLATSRRPTPSPSCRSDLLAELADDIAGIEAQIKQSRRRSATPSPRRARRSPTSSGSARSSPRC